MRDPFKFGSKTFVYFDGAREHASDRAWFDAHQALYVDAVEVPLTHLVNQLRERLAPALPGIGFSPRRIARPLLRKTRDTDGSVLRRNATAYFSEPATSMFEMNPGIYLSFGAGPDDNVIACGIYMPSGRQLKELRMRCSSESGTLRGILEEDLLRQQWGGLSGERYKRFPKGFDENAPGSEYLWHKQFFLRKQLSRRQVCSSGFIDDTVHAMVAALPFLTWTRNAVGIYRKPALARED